MFNIIKNSKEIPLKYKKYKKYEILPVNSGEWRFKFENGYGASVTRNRYEKDKFDLMVLCPTIDGDLGYAPEVYCTTFGRMIKNYLENKYVLEWLEIIKNAEEL